MSSQSGWGCRAWRPADAQLVRRWVAEMLPHAYTYVDNDAVAALASGTGGDPGVVIISGTGMIVFGVDGEGRRRRAQGLGRDPGQCGRRLTCGAAILQSITTATNGSGPATALTTRVLDYLSLGEVQELIAWTYGQQGWAHVATLAHLAESCAAESDEVAFRILAWAADNLAQRAEAVIHGLGLETQHFPLVLAGGNLVHGELLRRLLTIQLEEVAPHTEIVTPYLDAAVGAALLAGGQGVREARLGD